MQENNAAAATPDVTDVLAAISGIGAHVAKSFVSVLMITVNDRMLSFANDFYVVATTTRGVTAPMARAATKQYAIELVAAVKATVRDMGGDAFDAQRLSLSSVEQRPYRLAAEAVLHGFVDEVFKWIPSFAETVAKVARTHGHVTDDAVLATFRDGAYGILMDEVNLELGGGVTPTSPDQRAVPPGPP